VVPVLEAMFQSMVPIQCIYVEEGNIIDAQYPKDSTINVAGCVEDIAKKYKIPHTVRGELFPNQPSMTAAELTAHANHSPIIFLKTNGSPEAEAHQKTVAKMTSDIERLELENQALRGSIGNKSDGALLQRTLDALARERLEYKKRMAQRDAEHEKTVQAHKRAVADHEEARDEGSRMHDIYKQLVSKYAHLSIRVLLDFALDKMERNGGRPATLSDAAYNACGASSARDHGIYVADTVSMKLIAESVQQYSGQSRANFEELFSYCFDQSVQAAIEASKDTRVSTYY